MFSVIICVDSNHLHCKVYFASYHNETLIFSCTMQEMNIFIFRSVIDFDEMAAGLNKRRMIQSAVYKELVKVSQIKIVLYTLLEKRKNILFQH